MKLRAKFTLAFLGCGLAPLLLGTLMNHNLTQRLLEEHHQQSRSIIEDAAKENLTGLLTDKRRQVENHVRRLMYETRSQLLQLGFARSSAGFDALRADFAQDTGLAPDALARRREALWTYYADVFAPAYEDALGVTPPNLQGYFDALDDGAVALQYAYLVGADDADGPMSLQEIAVARLTSSWGDRIDQSAFSGAYLIDGESGQVLWSKVPGIDLGIKLTEAPYRDFPLGKLFERASQDDALVLFEAPGPPRGPGAPGRGQSGRVGQGGRSGPVAPPVPGDPIYEPGPDGPRGSGSGPFFGPGFGRGDEERPPGHFQDFAPYFPDKMQPMAFVGQSFISESGSKALVVLKLSNDQLNQVMATAAGLRGTVEMLLVGPDYLPRTDSILDRSPTRTAAYACLNPEACRINIQPTRAVFELGQTSCGIYEDAHGQQALMAYAPVEFMGTTWAILARIGVGEAFAAADAMKATADSAFLRMRILSNFIALVAVIALCLVAVAVSKPIVQPLRTTVGILRDMAQGEGDLSRRLVVCARDEVGEMAQWFNIFMDKVQGLYRSLEEEVRERKRAQEKAAELTAFPRENPNPILSCTSEGTLHYANPSAQAFAANLGVGVTGLLPPDHAELVRLCVAEGGDRETESVVKGRVFWWRYNPVSANGQIHIYAYDITKRKEAEEQIRKYSTDLEKQIADREQAEAEIQRREEYYRSLIEYAPDVIITVDRDFRCTYISPAFERNFGRKLETGALLAERAPELFHPDDLEMVRATRRILETTPEAQLVKLLRIRNSQGEWRTVESRATNRLTDGVVNGIIINMHDVTERERAEAILKEYSETLERNVSERTMELLEKSRDLERAIENLKSTQDQLVLNEKMASLGALTAGIAHEIKNPLNFVNNFGELSAELAEELEEMLDKPGVLESDATRELVCALLEDLKQNARKIVEHGRRADSIVHSMLLHSRGKPGERQPTDLNKLLDEYLNLTYHGMRARDATFNIEFEHDYDPDLKAVRVVPQDIARVFLNVLSNACYAAHKRSLEGDDGYRPRLWVRTHAHADRAEIVIGDNGAGIPKEILDDIFNPFFTTKPAGEGTGLGLSISYDIIVREHGGELKVQSTPGERTEFTIVLPRG